MTLQLHMASQLYGLGFPDTGLAMYWGSSDSAISMRKLALFGRCDLMKHQSDGMC